MDELEAILAPLAPVKTRLYLPSRVTPARAYSPPSQASTRTRAVTRVAPSLERTSAFFSSAKAVPDCLSTPPDSDQVPLTKLQRAGSMALSSKLSLKTTS